MEINKEKLEEILKEQREEYQRYVEALVEMNRDVQKQLIALREMVIGKNRKIISPTFSTTRI